MHIVRRRLVGLATAGVAYQALRTHAEERKQPHDATNDVDTFEAALPQLRAVGYTVITNCCPRKSLEECMDTKACASIPTSSASDANAEWRLSSLGRFHRIAFSEEDEEAFAHLEKTFTPLVQSFFRDGEQGIDSVNADDDHSPPIFRSELQLLTAAPQSEHQSWHADNRRRGLTILVPLVDFSVDNGATQILPSSHALRPDSGLGSALRRVLSDGPVIATPKFGSALAYDARLYHRGMGNATAAGRPALVFRYDRVETPPPGVGVVGAVCQSAAATALHLIASAVSER